MLALEKREWDAEAEKGLAATFADIPAHIVAQWVDAGECELWNVNGDSWLITGIETDSQGRLLVAWCYQGKQARIVAAALQRIAKRNGIQRIQFSTYHKGLSRLLSNVAPRLIGKTEFGANLYEFIAQP